MLSSRWRLSSALAPDTGRRRSIQRPFDPAAAAEPKIPATPPPSSRGHAGAVLTADGAADPGRDAPGSERQQLCRGHRQRRFGERGQADRASRGLSRADPLRGWPIRQKGRPSLHDPAGPVQGPAAAGPGPAAHRSRPHCCMQRPSSSGIRRSSRRTRQPRPRSITGTSSGRVRRRQLLNAQAQIALAKLNLVYTEVRAPFDGIVGKHLSTRATLSAAGASRPRWPRSPSSTRSTWSPI